MTKYKVYISIDGYDFSWVIIENSKVISRNATREELVKITTKVMHYNNTNICPRCIEENNITDKSILYPKNARTEKDKDGNNTGKWICYKHYKTDWNNVLKSMTVCRLGNINDPNKIFGDNCEELTCRVFGVDNLNKKNDNYGSPIDHSQHPILGILQTKGARFSRDVGTIGGWNIVYGVIEHEKQYDNMVIWCVNKGGGIIERGYIIPKAEINKRRSIGIAKNPSKGGWYREYRIKDKNKMNKINDIWSKILEEEKNKRKRKTT